MIRDYATNLRGVIRHLEDTTDRYHGRQDEGTLTDDEFDAMRAVESALFLLRSFEPVG